jgi:hypothetical protein
MGVQRGGPKKSDTDTLPSGFSPGQRAKKATEDLRTQIMNLCGGNIIEFKELMASDVSTYLLKFELFIKQQQKNGSSRN